jgi:hypothetical protein
MSTEETGEEELKEGERSEGNIILSSLEEETLQEGLPAELPIPPAITTTTVVATTTKKKVTDEFDNYNTDIMSSDS